MLTGQDLLHEASSERLGKTSGSDTLAKLTLPEVQRQLRTAQDLCLQ